MRKITLLPFQDSGVGFYRILQPGRVLVREGLCKKAISLPFSGEQQSHFYEFNDKFYMKSTENTDVIWSTVVYRHEYILKLLNLREHNQCKTIFDMDDNLYAIPMDNPAAKDAEPLKENFAACLRSADGVTVSTPILKKLYEKINPNIYVIPNGLDFNIWDKVKAKKQGKTIRIGWRGGFGHRDDLELIRGALEAISKDYKVKLVTLGWEGFQFDSVEKHGWVSIFDYPKKLASLNLDIAIVPLVDSAYNRCKSNIAFLEYAALKIPVVLSPTFNQKDTPGLYANSNYEWYDQLEKLIKDSELRKEIAQKQYQYIKKNYDIRKLVHPLAEWMTNLKRRKDLKP